MAIDMISIGPSSRRCEIRAGCLSSRGRVENHADGALRSRKRDVSVGRIGERDI